MKRILVIVLMVAVLLSIGCGEQKETATIPTNEADSQVDMESNAIDDSEPKVSPKGTVITSDEVINEIGGYSIPIPVDWFGKASYELMDNVTYIYHITNDASESEINPILLLVDIGFNSASEGVYSEEDVFLSIGDADFYSVPRFDFPYSSTDSQDGIEFNELYADIPMMLQSAWYIEGSVWESYQKDENIETSDVRSFSPEDATIDGIKLGIEKEFVLDNLSDSYMLEFVESYELEATGEMVEEHIFDFGKISFTDGIFTSAEIYDPEVECLRGLRVGDDMDADAIAEKFTFSFEGDVNGMKLYYRLNEMDDLNYIIPPSCVYYIGENLVLDCFAEENITLDLSMEELKEIYMYETIYSCTIEFDDLQKIASIRLFYGASAE